MRRLIPLLAVLLLGSCATGAETSAADPESETTSQQECPAKLAGRVLIEFEIDPDGNVVAPRVLEYEPSDIFNKAALKAVQEWKYDGTGETQENIRVSIPFRLKDPCD